MARRLDISPSPFAQIERAFDELGGGLHPLIVQAQEVGGKQPLHALTLEELRTLLLQPTTTYGTKDRVLGLVVRRAQNGEEPWALALAGLLMPGLRGVRRRLLWLSGSGMTELEAEILVGFAEAVAELDPDADRVAARICWRAYRHARRALDAEVVGPLPVPVDAASRVANAHQGTNPEVALARVVRAGLVAPADAEVIAATRIERRSLTEVATSLGIPLDRLQKRRLRAEARIASFIARETGSRVLKEQTRPASSATPGAAGCAPALPRPDHDRAARSDADEQVAALCAGAPGVRASTARAAA